MEGRQVLALSKDEAIRLDAILISIHRARRRFAFASRHAFFEAQILGVDKLPHGAKSTLSPRSAHSATRPHSVKSPPFVRCKTHSRSPEIASACDSPSCPAQCGPTGQGQATAEEPYGSSRATARITGPVAQRTGDHAIGLSTKTEPCQA